MNLASQLEKRPLGTTGLQLSILGLGTVKWGRNQGVKYPAFELPSDATLHHLLDVAEEFGVNFLDVAPAYGIAEERIGRILSDRSSPHPYIFTKTGEEFENGTSSFDFSSEQTRRNVERSLRRLRLDHLDAVQIHCAPDDLHTLQQTPVLETLQHLKASGTIRSIGVSTMTVAGGLWAADHVDFLMVPYSIGYRDHLPVIETAAAKQVGILIKRALYSGPSAEQKLPLRDHLQAVFAPAGVTAMVAGTINPDHLRENILTAKELTNA